MIIGILTQPMHWNYGGIIQNWALQQVLRAMGHKPVKFEYTCDWAPLPFLTKLKRDTKTVVLSAIGRGRNRELLLTKIPTQLSLRGLQLKHSSRFTSLKRLQKLARKVDAFIVGSDQVWREEYSPGIEQFFLTFLPDDDPRPRVSYAASFGKSKGYIAPQKMNVCRAGLKKFTSVSVRESESLEILRRDFNRNDATVVLDPTLLLKATDYEGIMAKQRPIMEPYVSAYFLDETPTKRAIFDSLTQKAGLSHIDLMGAKHEHFDGARIPTIGQWLRSIADSEMVITDSFHGMAFSLIFHKPFIVLANKQRGIERFRTILESIDLSDRLIADDTIPTDIDSGTQIDWQKIDTQFESHRLSSMDFLKNALKQN